MTTKVDRSGEPQTAVEMWRRRVGKSAGAVAFRFKKGGAWVSQTFGETDQAAHEVAAGLAALGVEPGDRVAIVSQTRVEWILADLGTLLAGGVPVPVYASNTPEVCEFIIRDSGAKVVIAEDASQVEKLLARRSALAGVVKVVHVAGDAKLERPDARGRKEISLGEVSAQAGDWLMSWDALREAGRAWLADHPGEIARRDALAKPDTMFTIIYTSGTTGNPKGVALTHENLTAAVCSAVRALTIHEHDSQFLFLPLAHVLARELEWAAIEAGVPTSIGEGVSKIKDNLVETRPTFMAAVPRVLEKFYAAVLAGSKQGSPLKRRLVAWAFATGRREGADRRAGRPGGGVARALADKLVLGKLRRKLGLDRCRFLISGGAPLAAEIAEFFHGTGILVLEGYGLTETMAAAFVNRVDRFRFGTVGPAIDVVEVKFAPDGEVLMRGPSVFHEYFGNPAATAEAVEPDGWFHSGDIGQIEDGFLRITDRKKDLIVTAGGKKIAPQAIENALKAGSSLISQVLVYGDRRPYCVALVTVSEDTLKLHGRADAPALREALQRDFDGVNARLASFESVKSFTVLGQDWSEATGELTPSLKVKRKVVLERFAAEVESLYAGRAAAE